MSRYIFVKINDDITSIKRLKEMFPNITEEDFKTILASDPTYNNNKYEAGKYGRWLLSLFNKNNLKKEDLYKAKEYLEKFDKKKAKFSNKDINAYKNLPDLYKAIEEMENKEPTKSELKRNVQRTDLDKDAELFMETENFKIYIPKTYEASCKLGSETEWCTATRSNREYYDRYTSGNNKLYVMISKKDPLEKYQWNTKQRYTCDRKDEEISEAILCVKYPDLANFFDKFGYNIKGKIEKIKEYVNGKEYIYDGKKIDSDIFECLKKVKVSNSLKEIRNRAFEDCRTLESVEIPDSITKIGNEAFWNCRSLTSIEIPNSVTSIGDSAFYACGSLKGIKIPNSVTRIDKDAFTGCSSLESAIIQNGEIGAYAFVECSSLKIVKIENGVTSIGAYAFGECKSLTSITIPESVTDLDNFVFDGCDSLKSIEIQSKIIDFISPYTFRGCSPDLVIKTKNPYLIEFCEEYGLRYSEE